MENSKDKSKLDKADKLERECEICGKKPAYYSIIAKKYVCINHLIEAVGKYMSKAAIGGAILLIAYLIF